MAMTKATDITITLEDKPGTLAAAADALGKAGVNIDGMCAAVDGARTPTVHLVFARGAGEAKAALAKAGVTVTRERDVMLVDLADRPGSAAAELAKIARAGQNVDLAYLATGNRLVVGGADAAKIAEALGR